MKTVQEYLEAYLPPSRGKVVLHWFTGSKSEMKRALEFGCYFSINAAMLTNERLLPMIQAIPLDRLLTETDGPFTQTCGRPTMPSDVALVFEGLAKIYGLPPVQMAKKIRGNLRILVA
jgi:TatD DNase family protein